MTPDTPKEAAAKAIESDVARIGDPHGVVRIFGVELVSRYDDAYATQLRDMLRAAFAEWIETSGCRRRSEDEKEQ